MKKIKLKLNKKVVTALSQEEMQQAQGGHSYYLCYTQYCGSGSCYCGSSNCPSATNCASDNCPSDSGCGSGSGGTSQSHSYYMCC